MKLKYWMSVPALAIVFGLGACGAANDDNATPLPGDPSSQASDPMDTEVPDTAALDRDSTSEPLGMPSTPTRPTAPASPDIPAPASTPEVPGSLPTFASIDSDADGEISADEWKDSGTAPEEGFESLDENGDGALSDTEFQKTKTQ